jgi:hypothetical protein
MATPKKGSVVYRRDTGSDASPNYDDILGDFRKNVINKVVKAIQYHKDNIKTQSKSLYRVGIYDAVNSERGEGTWHYYGRDQDWAQYKNIGFDFKYDIDGDSTDRSDWRWIKLTDILNGEDLDNLTVDGQMEASANSLILGEKDIRDFFHYGAKNFTSTAPDSTALTGWGSPVEEGEFSQSVNYSISWQLATHTRILCQVRKATIYERSLKTTETLHPSAGSPTVINLQDTSSYNNYRDNDDGTYPYTANSSHGLSSGLPAREVTSSNKQLKDIYEWFKSDAVGDTRKGWTHFTSDWISTDNYAWEILKRLTTGNILAREFNDWANSEDLDITASTPYGILGNVRDGLSDGPANTDYGKKLTATNLQTAIDRMYDLWGDFGDSDSRKVWIVLDYCHTSCHSSCHSNTIYVNIATHADHGMS